MKSTIYLIEVNITNADGFSNTLSFKHETCLSHDKAVNEIFKVLEMRQLPAHDDIVITNLNEVDDLVTPLIASKMALEEHQKNRQNQLASAEYKLTK